MQNKKIIFFSLIAALSCFAIYTSAWQNPTQAPPDGNPPPPINAGADKQEKLGGLKLLFAILNPSDKPENEEGTAYYDKTAKLFKCFQSGQWYNCLGYILPKLKADGAGFEADILEIANPNTADKKARIANLKEPVNSDEAATKGFVLAQGTGGAYGGHAIWDIYITPGAHDGNFGGWPGIDRYCQAQIGNPHCVVFSSDIFKSLYVASESINFSSWDTSLGDKGWYATRLYAEPGTPQAWNAASQNCKGWTSNNSATAGYYGNMFYMDGSLAQGTGGSPCNMQQHALCACPR